MASIAKSVFNRKVTEDKNEPVVETRAASANNGDAGIASTGTDGHDQFQTDGGAGTRRTWFEYIKTREFWMALALG